MTAERLAFARAAEGLVGAQFRLHGRDPAMGLDCVGLVCAALHSIGREHSAPADYSLRNRDFALFEKALMTSGFSPAHAPAIAGDILVAKVSAAQFHLLIQCRDGDFVHAHAGLRRVVRTPAPLAWPVTGHWRLKLD